MELRTKYHEFSDAAVNYIQVSHRRDAVEYAIAGIKKVHDANLELLGHDPFNSEMEGRMQAWVAETLYQGAYLREYHLWEKDCKAYFLKMALRNGEVLEMTSKGPQPFTDRVRDILDSFSVALPTDVFEAIEDMRVRVNVMKHEAGLELEHFITETNYTEAVQALEEFWNQGLSLRVRAYEG
jgi:hypothetical protein